MVGNGEHLGLVLSRFGIMQKDAAAAVGVDPAMVTRWKNGKERLSADSPRMEALVDFLLSPGRSLSEDDMRWLRSRFAEEGMDTHFADVTELRDALASYLANDGSRIGQEQRDRRELFVQDQFALAGTGTIVEVVRGELAKVSAGRAFYVVCTAASIETEPTFVNAVEGALRRGVRLRLLVANAPGTDGQDDGEDRVTQTYLPFSTSPDVQIRYARTAAVPLLSTSLCTTVFVPGRLCLHISRPVGGASPIACGIREHAYVAETERAIVDAWAQAASAFEDPHEATPRVISGNMARFYRETSGLRVASDGLNPLFMGVGAFERLLERKGISDAEISWRVEAFEREQGRLEDRIARGVPYREMTTAVDAHTVREQGSVVVYGTTLVDARSVDVPTALDILQGYLRFATLYPHFDLRFANPSRELSDGLWMLCDAPQPMHEDEGDVIIYRWEEGGVRQLVSHHSRIMGAVRELFDNAWGRFRFRIWHEGRLVTSNDDADPSLTIRFIREKIAELESL